MNKNKNIIIGILIALVIVVGIFVAYKLSEKSVTEEKEIESGSKETMSDGDFYISKYQDFKDNQFNEYLTINDRKLYLASNIEEFFIIENGKKMTYKAYIFSNVKPFNESIKSITDKLDEKEVLKDGGTTIYKSKDKDITLVECKTDEGNNNIYIGDYSMNFDKKLMCE